MKQERDSSVKMGYINPKMRRKLKLIGRTAAALGGAVIIAVSGSSVVQWFKNLFGKSEINIPRDKASVVFEIELEDGDTVSEIAEKYYTDETQDVYGSFSHYTTDIEKQNRKSINSIEAGDTVEIPVIVDKDNPYYLNVLDIKNKIKELEENNLWVDYSIKQGDRIYNLAKLASGDEREIYDLENKIFQKNHINPKDILGIGKKISIINPELGKLKQELNEAMEQLKLSLVQKNAKK